MKELEEKILKEGHALSENILKVDSFINHQVDPVLMQQIGRTFRKQGDYQSCYHRKLRDCSGTNDGYLFERSNDHFKETAF